MTRNNLFVIGGLVIVAAALALFLRSGEDITGGSIIEPGANCPIGDEAALYSDCIVWQANNYGEARINDLIPISEDAAREICGQLLNQFSGC